MTTEQALNILINATSQLNANRESHIAILNAVEVLKKALFEANVSEKK